MKWLPIKNYEAFIPNPDNLPEVNHIDGNRQNNHVENLEWISSIGNVQHAINTGLKIYTNRLTEEEFLECIECVINNAAIGKQKTAGGYSWKYL